MKVSFLASRYCSMLSVNEWILSLTALYPSLRYSSGKSHSAISSNIISAQWDIVNKANTASKSPMSFLLIINSNICTNESSTRGLLSICREKTSISELLKSTFEQILSLLNQIRIRRRYSCAIGRNRCRRNVISLFDDFLSRFFALLLLNSLS